MNLRERLEAAAGPPDQREVVSARERRALLRGDKNACVYGTILRQGGCPKTTQVECNRLPEPPTVVTLATCNSACRFRCTELPPAEKAAVQPVGPAFALPGDPTSYALQPARPAPIRAAATPTLPRVLLMETKGTHIDLYRKLIAQYRTAGGHIDSVPWQPGAPLWNVPALVKQHKPDVVLRWEEHGQLFTKDSWRDTCKWMYKQGIMPAMLDWGFFAHFKSLYMGYFREDGKPDLRDVWDDLPEIPDWSKASPEVVAWKNRWLDEYADGVKLGPVPGTEMLKYVLIWVQYSANGSRFRGWTGENWCANASRVLRAQGLFPVFKLPPKPGKMPVPDWAIQYPHKGDIPLLTHRLIRFARHSVAITTTATNGCVLVGAPVVSCGEQWCEKLGVWRDTKKPEDMCITPDVDAKARGKWANYWIQRQQPLTEVAHIMGKLWAQWSYGGAPGRSRPAKPTRSIYMLGRGLGNMLMAVPAIKALAAATGTQVEVTGSKAHNKSFLSLLKDERYVKSVSSENAKDAKEAIIGGAALNYPAAIAQEKFGGEAQLIDIAKVRNMTSHESEQDAQAARNLGFDGPLPLGRIYCAPPPRDMPPSYVAVCMECAPRWPAGKKRQYPYWQKFAKQWRGPPLVFVGKEPVPWVMDHGIDRTGDHPLALVASIIGGADVFVSIDCGLSHVAAAVGVPSLVLYGPTTSYHTGPYVGALTTLDGRHPCRSCFGRPEWETCTAPKCMSSIRPEAVVEALKRILWRRGRPLEAETAREQMRGRWYQTTAADRQPSQWPQELDALWSQVAEIQAEHVLELGVKRGGWMYVMAPAFRPGAHLIGVDLELRTVGRNGLQGALQTEGFEVDLIEGDCHMAETEADVHAALNGAKLDILHIDDNHEVESCLDSWRRYRPLLRSGGLGILHDAFKVANPKERADVRAAIEILKVEEGRKVLRWRWIQQMRDNGSAGPGICVAEIA